MMDAIRHFGSGARIDEIEACYRARSVDFARFASAVTGDQDLGYDVVQEAFATAIRKRRSFQRTGLIDAWICRIVLNKARNARRTRARHRSEMVVDPALAPTALSNGGDESHPPDELLEALPDRQRIALFLRYYADMDYQAIAETMGVKTGTVAATLHAGHEALRRQIPREALNE